MGSASLLWGEEGRGVGQKAAGTGRSLELAYASRMQLTAFENLRFDNLLHPLSAPAQHARHVRISNACGWAMRLGRRRRCGGGRWGRGDGCGESLRSTNLGKRE